MDNQISDAQARVFLTMYWSGLTAAWNQGRQSAEIETNPYAILDHEAFTSDNPATQAIVTALTKLLKSI